MYIVFLCPFSIVEYFFLPVEFLCSSVLRHMPLILLLPTCRRTYTLDYRHGLHDLEYLSSHSSGFWWLTYMYINIPSFSLSPLWPTLIDTQLQGIIGNLSGSCLKFHPLVNTNWQKHQIYQLDSVTCQKQIYNILIFNRK